jgi:hypothetical protein
MEGGFKAGAQGFHRHRGENSQIYPWGTRDNCDEQGELLPERGLHGAAARMQAPQHRGQLAVFITEAALRGTAPHSHHESGMSSPVGFLALYSADEVE